MAQQMVTAPMRRKANALVSILATCSTGTSKVTGQRFYVVPATKPLTAHWTAVDGSGCTCIGFNRRGTCTHAIAARMRAEQQEFDRRLAAITAPRCPEGPEDAPVPTLRASYDTLYRACQTPGCLDITEDGRFCGFCCARETRRLDAESRAAVFATIAPFTLNPLAE